MYRAASETFAETRNRWVPPARCRNDDGTFPSSSREFLVNLSRDARDSYVIIISLRENSSYSRSNQKIRGNSRDLGSRRRNSTSFAGSLRARRLLQSLVRQTRRRRSDEMRARGQRRGSRGGSHTFVVRIRGRWSTQLSEVGTENTNGGMGH